MASIEEWDDAKLAKAASVAVACQNCPSEKTLHKSHRSFQHFLGGTLWRGGYLVFRLGSGAGRNQLVKSFLASCSYVVGIGFKLFPKCPVLTTDVDQPLNVSTTLCGIKAGEIDELHCDGAWGSVKSRCRVDDLWVSLMKFAKRNSAIKIKTSKQLGRGPVAATQNNLIGKASLILQI